MNLYELAIAKKLSGGGGGGGGGGGASYTLIHEQDLEVTYSSTSAVAAVQIPLSAEDVYTDDCIIYIRIRDKAGKRNGYWYGSDNYSFPKNHIFDWFYYVSDNGTFTTARATDPGGYGNGLYLREIKSNGYVRIDKKYNNGGIIDGTYHIEVYKLDWPGGVSPFN